MIKDCCNEYCSTHGCNQGKHCIARIERIAQAKRNLDRIEPLRFMFWRMVGIAAVSTVFVFAYVTIWEA